jgi:hypothetical protein
MNINPKLLLVGLLTEAGSNAKLTFYTAPQPAAGAAVGSATEIAELPQNAILGTITDDATYWIFTFNTATPDTTIPQTQTTTWARLTSGSNFWLADFTVSNTNGSGDIKMSPTDEIYKDGILTGNIGTIKVAK